MRADGTGVRRATRDDEDAGWRRAEPEPPADPRSRFRRYGAPTPRTLYIRIGSIVAASIVFRFIRSICELPM